MSRGGGSSSRRQHEYNLAQWEHQWQQMNVANEYRNDAYDIQVANYAWGFYHHQFCKAKVLKDLFLSDYLSDYYKLKGKGGLHTELVHGNSLQGLKMLSPRVNNVTFGEPLANGRITPEGLSYLAEYDCKIPEYGSTDIDKIF